ncbi:MAG: hypothetical protein IH934_06480 [Nanoarchaeota archaeon]|nr:hypothetical protein [Nanoarchaeota archaeon]
MNAKLTKSLEFLARELNPMKDVDVSREHRNLFRDFAKFYLRGGSIYTIVDTTIRYSIGADLNLETVRNGYFIGGFIDLVQSGAHTGYYFAHRFYSHIKNRT